MRQMCAAHSPDDDVVDAELFATITSSQGVNLFSPFFAAHYTRRNYRVY